MILNVLENKRSNLKNKKSQPDDGAIMGGNFCSHNLIAFTLVAYPLIRL